MKKDDVGSRRTVMIAMRHVGDTLGNSGVINLGRYQRRRRRLMVRGSCWENLLRTALVSLNFQFGEMYSSLQQWEERLVLQGGLFARPLAAKAFEIVAQGCWYRRRGLNRRGIRSFCPAGGAVFS